MSLQMRKYHRWIGAPLGVFMAFIAITGVLLAIDDMTSHEPTQRRQFPANNVPQPGGLRAEGAFPAGPQQPMADALAGERVAGTSRGAAPDLPDPQRAKIHGWLEHLHRGAFAGWPGMIVALLCGVSLLVLSVTGLAVYVDMFRRRAKGSRRTFFWH